MRSFIISRGKLIHSLVDQLSEFCRDKNGKRTVQFIEYDQIITQMFDSRRLTEISVHIAVASESKDHAALVIVSENPSSVAVEAGINIVIHCRYIRQIGRTRISAAGACIEISDDLPFAVAHQDIISHEVQFTDDIHAADVLFILRPDHGIDEALVIHIYIVIFRRNKRLHLCKLFLGGDTFP